MLDYIVVEENNLIYSGVKKIRTWPSHNCIFITRIQSPVQNIKSGNVIAYHRVWACMQIRYYEHNYFTTCVYKLVTPMGISMVLVGNMWRIWFQIPSPLHHINIISST